MYRKTLIAMAVAAACLSGEAFAWDYKNNNTTYNQPKAYGGKANANASQGQLQGQLQGQGQKQSMGQSQSSRNLNLNSVYGKNTNKNYNAAGAFSGSASGAYIGGVSSYSRGGESASYSQGGSSSARGGYSAQGQSVEAVGSGNATVIEGDTYEAPKKPDLPAYAPDAIAAPATAPCIKTWAASGGGLGLFSLGGAGYVKDHVCSMGEVARRAAAQGNAEVADEALGLMLQLAKEEAGLTSEVHVVGERRDVRTTSGTKKGVVVVKRERKEADPHDVFWFNNI